MNKGGVWLDPSSFFGPNYGACIALLDPKAGATCTAAYDVLAGCTGVACDACSTASEYTNCVAAVEATGGGCSPYDTKMNIACKADLADGGAASPCFAGGSTMLDPAFTFIINLICGSGAM